MNEMGALVVAIAGFFLTWTVTIIGGIIWLNKQFSAVKDEIALRIPYHDYERRHDILVDRVTGLEKCMQRVKAKLNLD